MTLEDAFDLYCNECETLEQPTEATKDVLGAAMMEYFSSLASRKGVFGRDKEDLVMEACLLFWRDATTFQNKNGASIATWSRNLFENAYRKSVRPTLDALCPFRYIDKKIAKTLENSEDEPTQLGSDAQGNIIQNNMLVPLKDAEKIGVNTFEFNMNKRMDLDKWKKTLDLEERRLIDLKLAGYEDVEVAEKMGLQLATMRKRFLRLKQNGREFFNPS